MHKPSVLPPHSTIEVPQLSAELLAETDEMVAVKFNAEGAENNVLCAFERQASMEPEDVTAKARLAVVRNSADGEVKAGLLSGTELRVDEQPMNPVVPGET